MVLKVLICLGLVFAGLAMIGVAVYLMWQLGLLLAGVIVVWAGATRINVEPRRRAPEITDETEVIG